MSVPNSLEQFPSLGNFVIREPMVQKLKNKEEKKLMNKLLFTETNHGNSIHDRERFQFIVLGTLKKDKVSKTIQNGKTKSLKSNKTKRNSNIMGGTKILCCQKGRP